MHVFVPYIVTKSVHLTGDNVDGMGSGRTPDDDCNTQKSITEDMRNNVSTTQKILHKDVVVIGNGPSGICVSLMLNGWVPYLKSFDHPDEMLSARLHTLNSGISLAEQAEQLGPVAVGLEGRSSNPISLLLDALEHPCADMGLEAASMLEWRQLPKERHIDHVVLGRGPPGGSWHSMDPNILTLSLGSWMALPGMPYSPGTSGAPGPPDSQRRATAGSVASYYKHYVQEMGLLDNFVRDTQVLTVEQFSRQQSRPERRSRCSIINAIDYIRSRTRCHKKSKDTSSTTSRSSKRSRNHLYNGHDLSPDRKVRDLDTNCHQSQTNELSRLAPIITASPVVTNERRDKWLVRTVNTDTGDEVTYSCEVLILAIGTNDLPNRLGLSAETYSLSWVLHDLRALEHQLDESNSINMDPVLIVGAGLSAADAVIATRFRSIPVLHVFRSKSVSLDKQLPENMYPEYHKVHQMMLDGGSTYSLYTALPEYEVIDISEDHIVTLESKTGPVKKFRVSYVVILIGSRPDLQFLPSNFTLGKDRTIPVDTKSNPVDIEKMTHSIRGYDGLYAMGPLAGDNFVRFIPGGALAIVSNLYSKRNW